ncbi:MAG: ParB/RepB/Spo0J family partition protein [Huintestinicola sp.]
MALGRGLDNLFDDNAVVSDNPTSTLRLSEIEPNKNQPRKVFDEAQIAALAESIREHGLIQPILVRPAGNGMTYQIVAGERRWRACRMLGLDEVPVIIRELDDFETSQIALIENVQRSDLNPVEEASAYKELMETYGMTQDALSKAVGKSRSVIANSVRLLALPGEVRGMLEKGEISVGHAKALGAIEDQKVLIEIAKKAANGQLTVRQIEKLAADINKSTEDKPKTAAERSNDSYFTEMEISLKERLGRRIKISSTREGKGSLVIDFFDREDLSRIAELLSRYSDNQE